MKREACPYCKSSKNTIKKGKHTRFSDKKKIQRYYCKYCSKNFCEQTLRFDYRLKKRHINQAVFKLLCKGLSERACALVLNVKPHTIARRVVRFGILAKKNLEKYRKKINFIPELIFDEMESFEHTKCKPLTIPIAVENKTRRILAISVGKIRAKGHLAKISVKKYGQRKCERKEKLSDLFEQLKNCCSNQTLFISDKSTHYPDMLKKFFPKASREVHKGRKACIVGQGELKAIDWDPLFSFNHSAAMIRDNIKRLSRKTWCTTKKILRLEYFLNIYAWFHNLVIDKQSIYLQEI